MCVEEHEAIGGVEGEKEGAKLVDGRIDGGDGGEKVEERHKAHEEDWEGQQILHREMNLGRKGGW